jgi:hypothetical protein
MAMATRTDGERTRTARTDEGVDLVAGARSVADGVAGAAGSVVNALPDAAASTRAAVDEAARRIEAGSDEMLTVGTTFSLGLALGLLIGGANRILVAAALIPVAAIGMTLIDRGGRGRRSARGA